MISNTKVVVIDDHPLMAQATKELLEQMEGIHVVGVGYDGKSGLELVDLHRPHMVFLDYQLPDLAGTEIAKQIKVASPKTHVVIFTGIDISPMINKLFEIEVSGVISKGTSNSTIKNMVACILENHVVIPYEVLHKVVIQPKKHQDLELTKDEIEIMKLIVKGATLEQIADKIHISKRSVDNYQRKIYDKFGVRTRTQAVEKFITSDYYQ
jgi:two-component system competent response regulator ComA